jgi:riboflavin synthase
MFSGIIEAIGFVRAIETFAGGKRLWIEAPFVHEISLGQSIAHNGACLTVTAIKHRYYCVEAVQETLSRTNLGTLELNSPLNLERSLPLNGRWEGHIVQGHIDTTLTLLDIQPLPNDSFYFFFELPPAYAHLVVEKGSIAINGVSLTIAKLHADTFAVAIIPWTYRHTTFQYLKAGDRVNVEFDLLAKYFWRWASLHASGLLSLAPPLFGGAEADKTPPVPPATKAPSPAPTTQKNATD